MFMSYFLVLKPFPGHPILDLDHPDFRDPLYIKKCDRVRQATFHHSFPWYKGEGRVSHSDLKQEINRLKSLQVFLSNTTCFIFSLSLYEYLFMLIYLGLSMFFNLCKYMYIYIYVIYLI